MIIFKDKDRERDRWEEKDTITAWVWAFHRIATPHFLFLPNIPKQSPIQVLTKPGPA